MKCKKLGYLLVLIIMITVGIKPINADEVQEKTCFYLQETAMLEQGEMSENPFRATLKLKWGGDPNGWGDYLQDYAQVRVDSNGQQMTTNEEPLKNWIDVDGWFTYARNKTDSPGSPSFEWFYDSFAEVEDLTNAPRCPRYLVFEHGTWGIDTYAVWATNSRNLAEQAYTAAQSDDDHNIYIASNENQSGGQLSAEDYYGEFVELGLIDLDANGNIICEDLFGDESDPNSLNSLINTVMDYVRVIVPILIILLGTVDLAKAVIAGKEDNMKKAQSDFAKRIIIGVAIFFVPLFVNVILDLGEHVWQRSDGENNLNYEICEIIK